MQPSKFSDTNIPKANTTGLAISKAGKKTLSKNQQEFNKLTLRIEKLQKEIEKKQDKFDMAVKMYGANLHPLKVELVVHRRENILILWEHFKSNKLGKKDQRALEEILVEQLQEYFYELVGPPDEAIKIIFNELQNKDYDKALEEGKEEARKNMRSALKKMKVDVSDIDTNDIDALQEKIDAYNAEMVEKNHEKFEKINQFQKEKKKSVKQLEAEKLQAQFEEAKKKNIATIYKQLAKLFHPDLEQDEALKAEKALLMQELTAAYESKNLHALLTLELKWIHKENTHLESLTEEKLAVYLTILKEQIQNLNYQKEEIIHLPQYAVLLQQFGWQIKQNPVEVIHKTYIITSNTINQFKENTELFKSDHALKYIKQMIKKWVYEQNEMDEEEFIEAMFGK